MDKRKRIGLIYNYNESWIGGTYYIENIIHALNTLSNDLKPQITIYTASEELFLNLKFKTAYPHLKYFCTNIKFNIVERIINKLSRIILHKNIITNLPKQADVEWVFPNPDNYLFGHFSKEKKIYWIPDFQEEHLPQFFAEDYIKNRKKSQTELADNARQIIFSSNDALKDFDQLYPWSKANKTVMSFAVSKAEATYNKEIIKDTLAKFKINKAYFIIPNQLWIHKNHETVLKAIQIISKQDPNTLFIFTGKEEDYRFPDFPNKIKGMVAELNIQNQAKFLGFISKVELEILVQESIAIIQPSLFEGWSTTIEEAKAQNKFILASDICIHNEQLANYPNKEFFEKINEIDLAYKLLNTEIIVKNYDYNKDVTAFSHSIIKLTK